MRRTLNLRKPVNVNSAVFPPPMLVDHSNIRFSPGTLSERVFALATWVSTKTSVQTPSRTEWLLGRVWVSGTPDPAGCSSHMPWVLVEVDIRITSDDCAHRKVDTFAHKIPS